MALIFGANETYQFDRDLYLAAGMTYTRTTLKWSLCEPVDGGGISFAVSPDASLGPLTYTEIAALAKADGVTIIFTITDPPAWASGGGVNQIDPAYYARFKTFCQTAAVAFGADVIYEPFNEVTSPDFYWDESDYPTVLSYAATGIRAGSPSAQIMHAGLVAPDTQAAQDLLKTLCLPANKHNWDICSFHVYGAESFVAPATQIYRAILEQNKLEGRPLWVTETASGTKDGSVVATPEHAASDVVKRALDAYANGASLYMWWPISDAYLGSDNPSGLDPATKCMGLCWCPAKSELDLGAPYVSHARISYTAFATMVEQIRGFMVYRELAKTVRQITLDGRSKWIAWAGTGLMPTWSGSIRVTTHLGVASEVEGSDLVLTDSPVYIELVDLMGSIEGTPGEGLPVPSSIEIANVALALLGERPLVGFDDDSDVARQVNVVFQPTIDAVFDSYEWNCATFRADLNVEATAPTYDWAFSYTLPTSPYCLRVLALNDDESCGTRGDRFKVEGRHLLTNQATAQIKYIGRITDMGQIDRTLYRALAFAVAADLAMGITGNANLATQVAQQRDLWMQRAMIRNDREGNIPTVRSTPMSRVRHQSAL